MPKGMLESLKEITGPADVSILGDAATESEIFLMALEAECSEDEFSAIMENASYEMALYGLIDDADQAMEAMKTIVKMNKKDKFSAIERRAAVRLAKKAKDPAYTKYAKGRTMMLENREIIYRKYGAKAKTEAKQIIQNSRRKATAMGSAAGKSITDKMDKHINEINAKGGNTGKGK